MNDITQKELKQYVYYKDGNLYWNDNYAPRARKDTRLGALCTRYARAKISGKNYAVHRLVWLYHHGAFPKAGLDHINRDPLDNRIENLRECDQSENSQNRRLAKDNTSGHIGVSKHKMTGKWQANICIRQKQYYLGLFESFELAVNAYNEAKATLHPYHPAIT